MAANDMLCGDCSRAARTIPIDQTSKEMKREGRQPVGDGVTDDTEALQALVDEVAQALVDREPGCDDDLGEDDGYPF